MKETASQLQAFHHKNTNIISLTYSHSYLSTPLNTFSKTSQSFCVYFAFNSSHGYGQISPQQELESKNHCKYSSRSARYRSTHPMRGFTFTVYTPRITESGARYIPELQFPQKYQIRKICKGLNTYIQVYIFLYIQSRFKGKLQGIIIFFFGKDS